LIEAGAADGGVAYCIGVGTNATFDLGLAAAGYEVHSFDPTPRALIYAEQERLGERGVRFHPVGIWNEPKSLRFFAPSNRQHVNYSVVDLHGTGDYIESACERLPDVMRRLGHSELKLLKLDVEGSWRPILDDMIDTGIRPKQLCVEFDSPTSTRKILSMVQKLEHVGYTVVWFERENFLFVLKSELEKVNG
jgi:FkbM family methyltransferase